MIMSTTLTSLLAKGLAAGAAALQLACSSPDAARKPAPAAVAEEKPRGAAQHGVASIYTDHRTASGERYSRHALAGAHKHLPLGCKCKVTNLKNGKSVIVRINDRGPYIRGRIIDLTPAAAAKLGFGYAQGLAKVKVERM
jgi:rare lipoprotein A